MTYVITTDDIAVGDAVSEQLEKMWWWYVIGGIISMIFGFFVISYRHPTVYAIIYLASGFFIAVGVFEIIGAIRIAMKRWLHIIFGLLWIGAGTAEEGIYKSNRAMHEELDRAGVRSVFVEQTGTAHE